MKHLNTQHGFTLVELVMAMAVFSFMLTIVMVGFIGVVKQNQTGMSQRATQQNLRLAQARITSVIAQGSNASIVPNSPNADYDILCVKQSGPMAVFEVKPVTVGTQTLNVLTLGYLSAGLPCGSATDNITNLTDSTANVVKFRAVTSPPNGASLGTAGAVLAIASASTLVSEVNMSTYSCKPGAGSFCAVTYAMPSAIMRGGRQ